jgi:polyphenol oxidase
MRLTSSRLNAMAGVVHGFSTRQGGCATAPLDSLNLAWDRGVPEETRENWRRFQHAIGLPDCDVAVVHQIHGDRVWAAEPNGDPLTAQADADAVFTQRPNELVAIRTADCVPVLLAGPGIVAAVHAGWRGTAKAIVAQAVSALCASAQCEPAQLVAAIGPCIGLEAYEVGEEVVEGLSERIDPALFVRRGGPRPHVDLKAANAALLAQAGVVEIDILPHCTYSEATFFSHRREGGRTGRMAAAIGFRRL